MRPPVPRLPRLVPSGRDPTGAPKLRDGGSVNAWPLHVIYRKAPTASASPRYFDAATIGSMALIVFFRGINVGGHRAFRPSVLAKEMGIYDAVNVGAAGTLVICKPGLRAKFLAELRRKLPFEATIAFCDCASRKSGSG
jgi:hypothetical protein